MSIVSKNEQTDFGFAVFVTLLKIMCMKGGEEEGVKWWWVKNILLRHYFPPEKMNSIFFELFIFTCFLLSIFLRWWCKCTMNAMYRGNGSYRNLRTQAFLPVTPTAHWKLVFCDISTGIWSSARSAQKCVFGYGSWQTRRRSGRSQMLKGCQMNDQERHFLRHLGNNLILLKILLSISKPSYSIPKC